MPNIPAHIIQARQEVGQKIAAEKLPSWAACPTIQYPARLSMEQCSSEWTARYKSQLIKGETLVDLTGGLGVDCCFLSESFTHTTYVEQQPELCQLATHNFASLGKHIHVVNAQCEDYLENMQPADVIFIDPARRDNKGGKVVLLANCTPNLLDMGNKLLQKCQTLLVKLSPMIDIDSVIKVFPSTQEVHIVAVNNECKEVLVRVKGDLIVEKGERRISVQGEREARIKEKREIDIICTNLPLKEQPFVFTRKAEEACSIAYSLPQTYLYEPNAAILKAGAFKQVAQQMGVHKLHPNSHLYTSDTLVSHFPGRIFTIDRITKVQKKEINDIEKANVSIRNFPGAVAGLRKKLKLKDGGDTYIFATTLHDNSKALIVCNKWTNPTLDP